MNPNWHSAQFKDFCDITRGGSPRPIHDYLGNEGMPWVKIADATAEHSRYISKTKEKIKLDGVKASVEVFPGDLILSNSATPGLPKFLKINACIHDGWMLLRNFKGLDIEFAYWLLLAERSKLVAQGNGSIFKNLKTDILKSHIVNVPPADDQKRIAEFLNTLDDSITLLQEINYTLEAIAAAIFKSWFIDFDPVRANQEGKQSEGIDKETAALFSSAFEQSKIGEIPKGWGVGLLGDYLEVLETGRRPKGGVGGIETGIPSIGAESISKIGDFDYKKIKFVSTEFFEKMKSGKLESGDVLLYKDGGKPGIFLPRVSMFGDGFPFEVCGINEHVFRLRIRESLGQTFLYFYLWSDAVMHELKHRGGKAAIPGINQSDVKELKIIVPPYEITEKYENVTQPMVSKILANSKKIKYLSDLRDALLPRLISGKVKLLNIEDQIEKTT